MFNPQYIVKYVMNRETKESETRIFDSTVKTLHDKFGNVEIDTTKPCSGPHSSFQTAQYACHILNMNHQQGYSGSDLCQMMERHLVQGEDGIDVVDIEPTFYSQFLEAHIKTISHYGFELKQVGPSEWHITKNGA